MAPGMQIVYFRNRTWFSYFTEVTSKVSNTDLYDVALTKILFIATNAIKHNMIDKININKVDTMLPILRI
jgi:hypothetical protein